MTLTNEQVIEIALKHGLKLQQNSLVRNESGLDFQVVFASDDAGEKWVLRLPRRNDVVPTAKKEKKILELVKGKLPIQSPVWEVFSDDLIAYKQLKGVPAGTIDPEAKAYVWEIDEKNVPTHFNQTLGKAMVALHNVDHKGVLEIGIPTKGPKDIRVSMKERMDNVKSEFGVGEELWKRWQNWLQNDDFWPKQTAFIHGDLHAGHILIDRGTQVTGFIDWTEARVDDPAHDFVSHNMIFGEKALKELMKAYEEAGGYVWPKMFEHIMELTAAYPVGIAEFAIKSDLDEYKEMAKQTLGVK
ncbi:phosphotransferase [Ornithinibacillus sp. L9]|uniref:Phosphotransferase n=1 Tax=Ornithinibacillus caprae TaxID=2678566 RepID=A0A6N8FIF9_9BACI|nr:macrolide 2'-phosphotransferase [Ornithinibacillus caprae]MUK89380.1 phosphotransferase [Ornithinibacillus caprae]